jgi:uncharacterized protein YfaS (alpha-2-macroglobulin family)
MKRVVVAALLLLLSAASVFAATSLRIISAGPVGEVASLAEANEIRVVFSEPMVVLGKIPSPVTAPFFHLTPSVKGTFRWSGTTTLIFTPDKPLSYATQYNVTIDKNAKSINGNTLDDDYKWSFTTPTIKLLNTGWYRKGGKSDAAIVMGLRFNQPVDTDTIVQHLKVKTTSHEFPDVAIPEEGTKRMTPAEVQAFEAKKAKAQAAASSNEQPVFVFTPTEWNTDRFPKGKDLVVLETKPGIASDTWLKIVLDEKLSAAGRAATGSEQSYTVELEPTFFVTEIDCLETCDPDWRNAITFRSGSGIPFSNFRKALTVTDITDPKNEKVVKPKDVTNSYEYPGTNYSFDEAGYSLLPAHTYAVRIDSNLTADDGQKLGYPWSAVIENWHRSAFVSFGSGHGVWETSGGSILPFHSRNYKSVTQWLAPLKLDELMPTMLKLNEANFKLAPPNSQSAKRTLKVATDKIQAIGLDLAPAIGSDNLGLAWAAIMPGEPIDNTRHDETDITATLVQATNLGISVKDSPQNSVILVTRLDDGKPVEGATVSIRDKANKVFWSGATDAKGIAVAPKTDLRRDPGQNYESWEVSWRALQDLHFIVTAEKDGDVAYVGSDWNEGISPWEFGTRYDVMEADPQLRGTVFVDRGVYKLGEEVHFKAIVRADTPDGMQLLPAGTTIDISVMDPQNQNVDERKVTVNAWSSAEWTFKLPDDVPLGQYSINGTVAGHRGTIYGNFLVAAYRRPEFRTDVTLNSSSPLAGTKLDGTITGRYLFGSPMSGKPVKWTYSKQKLFDIPEKITNRYDGFTFLGFDWDAEESSEDGSDYDPSVVQVSQNEGTLNEKGELKLKLETDEAAGWPYSYILEGTVTDVTRQQISNRASTRIDPAPWYIGIKTPPYFADSSKGVDTSIVAAGLDGLAVPGVEVKIELKRLQWTSVRKAEGNGFYEWETERKEVPADEWTITTTADPVPLHIPITDGGQYVLRAHASEPKTKRTTSTTDWFYALGEGYTAWERYDHNRIDLIPEKKTYRPGETARIMIKSPWESATALLTTEREGIRTWTPFTLTSTQQTIEVPISEKEIPNFYVSVLLLKGRTKKDPDKDGSDPGKPAFRLGYVELTVEDASKKLAVDVKANRDEFRPASKAKIDVNVKDAKGKPAQSEVTLWAVDYGVLSLTGYQTPEILDKIYLQKALQVANEDSRQRIVSRRVLTPKGGGEGGGGGRDAGPGMLRRDFRVLAFWLGSLVTDAKGRAHTEVTLPESLTTYRIMAVAGDKQSRFGGASAEVKINKPLMLTPSWPRFLAVGDKAYFGGVVHNTLKTGGKATVSIESLDPNVLDVKGSNSIEVKPGSDTEVRFDAEGKSVGSARVRMRVTMGRENDAFEDIIPVRVLVSPETVAAYGEAKPRAEERIEIPDGVVPGYGGLRVDLSSTAMIGLAEGAQYLVEYPYGCSEQRSSRALGLMLITDLGDSFSLPGMDSAKQKASVQSTLEELKKYQCGDGGFAYWPGTCGPHSSPYLTAYVTHVHQRAKAMGYNVDNSVLERAYTFLDKVLGEPKPSNEGWMPGYTAWQAFAVKILAEGGRNVDSHVNRVYEYRDRMPVFGISHLLDALIAKKETSGARVNDLHRRITNSILPEGGYAFVNELNDPYLLWFWNSNVRSTAMSVQTLVRLGATSGGSSTDEELVKRMVRWMMKVRKQGRWGNTQENAWAMEALVDYYRKYESEVPDFLASVSIGPEKIASEPFKGRSTNVKSKEFSMQQVLAKAPAGQQLPVVFTREGVGTLFYMMRLRYAGNVLHHQPLDAGFKVERSYSLQNGEGESTSFKAGDLILVKLRIRNTKERRYVAVTDPIPAGTEPVETWFATTATQLVEQQYQRESQGWWDWWERGGFDYVERHDDRVDLFATRLGEGTTEFSYLVRATTAGTFVTAPTHAEEMYEPEVFGRTGTTVVEIKK